MKTIITKILVLLSIILVSSQLYAQEKINKLEIEGDKVEVVTSKSMTADVSGALSTGETVTTECYQGMCYVTIDYKGRKVTAPIGDRITVAQVYEYDFGGDGDKELIVVNDYKGSSVLYVFAYSRGIIQKLYEKEIFNNKTVVKPNYIEFYLPRGLDTIWHYYQGIFWQMKEVSF
ncbi:MAG: hypothetical protein KAT31_02150 [Bacteroidales bacterium]|nr:hypothetical protein [Bacteroidales bacterium]